MAYVYRHIRLDKNEPFYIGIGSDSSYKRANSLENRNKYWRHINSKTTIEVEILIDNISWEEACEKEREFISIYGRISEGGILCNLTDGGEGTIGRKATKEQREILCKIRKKKAILCYTVAGLFHKEFESVHAAAKATNVSAASISSIAKGKTVSSNGFSFKYKTGEHIPQEILSVQNKINSPKSVNQYSLEGLFLNTYSSIAEAIRSAKVPDSEIKYSCKGKQLPHLKFKWSYFQS